MVQESDIPFRIIKEKSNIFSSFNDAIDKSYFPTTPVFEIGERYSKDTDP